ncbi:hypothetical protein K493DRAFT_298806 [Basidiobolus meristosporus CBS 931.73]|uniref:Uncharacterized protein n=1 Tax=Basidiobolus meristosporus CBS 931.73 TaxID=1314790 RepID=A0A1Y1YRF9_9FUNG|nr:hypothetical protein K493DRAFT_298806 [Basidiobolus meristosporus CBS 931.73]|eukprot:ORY00559.1 hypothetical protein K493DRAFT_298806 [Basidiobolus meristosporus CBS 931.73]
MRPFALATIALLAVVSTVQAGSFYACVNSGGGNCSERQCSKGNCCNFQADMKNNMASGCAASHLGCTIYYNSNCQGASFLLDNQCFQNLPAFIKNNNASVRCNF